MPPTTHLGWDPPERIEEYRIIRLLGAGGMGRVYLGEDTVLQRQVAVKFLHPLHPDDDSRARFLNEARAVARLQHQSVVSIYRVGEVQGHPYLVSEFVKGKTLDHVDLPLAWEQILTIALALARGLAAAHGNQVLHRDIKPANIIVGEDGAAKLLDFGLAQLGGEARREPGDEPGAAQPLVGTPLYLAPELWLGEAPSARSDLYSLGAVLFELATGAAPHQGLTVDEVREAALRRDVPSLTQCMTWVDARFAAIVDRCLAREPARRYASALELEQALSSLTTPAPKATPRRHRRFPLLIGGLLVLGASPLLFLRARPLAHTSTARPALVLLQPGTFIMGSPEDEPGRDPDEHQHPVQIKQRFYLAETEVTQGNYLRVMKGEQAPPEAADLPAVKVSWFDAVAYCNRLSALEGLEPCYSVMGTEVAWPHGLRCAGYRLPTEAEWEYAARAASPWILAGGNDASAVGWYAGNAQERLQPVRKKQPNAWGLYDLSGNVWEWVWDWHQDYPVNPSGPASDPIGPRLGAQRLNRGGSWIDDPRFLRLADRSRNEPATRLIILGFRIARSAL